MAEVFVTFNDTLTGDNGITYLPRACGREMDDGRWEGWIEFEGDNGTVVRSGRETTQPNRTDTAYWATGLTPVYLEGALDRALHPTVVGPPTVPAVPAFDGPAPPVVEDASPRTESVLNPFSVYRKGEDLLRRQLGALASWHLVNIIEDYGLSKQSRFELERLTSPQLLELIVNAVRTSSKLEGARNT
jgi:hypothetical protein